jgi:hypothetical protein
MPDNVLAALIGLAGSITASLIGGLITLHIHNSQLKQSSLSQNSEPPVREPGTAVSTPRRPLNLAIPFTAISLILAVLFGVFLAQTLRGPTPSPAPSPTQTATPATLPPSLTPEPSTAVVTGTLASPTTSGTPGSSGVNPDETASAQPATAAIPASTATPAQGVYGPGVRVQLTPGVFLTISQMQVQNGSLNWHGTVRNDSDSPFSFELNRNGLHFQDDTGQPVGNGSAQGNWPTDPLAAHTSADVTFDGSYSKLPSTLQFIDLVIDNLAGQGPYTFRRTLTLGTRASETAVPSQQGQQVLLSPGIYLVISQMPVQNGSLDWRGTFRNGSAGFFNFRLSRDEVHFTDSTGQPVGNGSAQGSWPDGDIAPGASAEVTFFASYSDLPAGLQYIDLTIDSLSGYGPFAFRRLLSLGPGPEAMPTVYQQGDHAVLTTGVYLVISQMQIQNGYATWQGTIHNGTNSPFNFRLERNAVHFQGSNGQPLNSQQAQGNWPDGDVPPQGTAKVTFTTYVGTPAPGITYLDLVIDDISGSGPFLFRRSLP